MLSHLSYTSPTSFEPEYPELEYPELSYSVSLPSFISTNKSVFANVYFSVTYGSAARLIENLPPETGEYVWMLPVVSVSQFPTMLP